MRWKLPRAERKRREALERAFETTKHWAIKTEHGKMSGVSTLLNVGFYLLIALRDIQTVKIDALTHPDEWSRKLNARVILLTIYEWDADEVSGRSLQEALDLMLISDDLRREAIASLRMLRKIQERAKKKFSFIRNAAIAHRDPNALVQYRAIRDLNVQDVWDIAAEFFAEVENFMSVLTRLMTAGNTLPSYLRQWSASTKAEEKLNS
jgi:hypothetical protein